MPSLLGRPQPAPTTGTTQRVPVMAMPLPSGDALGTGGTQTVTRHRRVTRRLVSVAGLLASGVLVAAVLAGAMSDAVTSRAVALGARAENSRVAAQVEAGRKESESAVTPAFLGFAARSYGYGRGSERPFALTIGAPAPPSIQPLGASPLTAPPPDALDAVLDLLFER